MKAKKYFYTLLIAVITSVFMVGCSDKDDDPIAPATTIAGNYSGNLSIMGYSDQYTAYVTLTTRSDNAVSAVVDCDELNLHLNAVILDVTQQKDGSYKLASTSKAVNGAVTDKNLNLNFLVGTRNYVFYGSK